MWFLLHSLIGMICRMLSENTVADPGGDPHGAKEPPFRLDLVLRSTDDRLNGITLSG